jgi:hypothetical protein
MDHIEEVLLILEGIKEETDACSVALINDENGEVFLSIAMANNTEIVAPLEEPNDLYSEAFVEDLKFKASLEFPWANSTLH